MRVQDEICHAELTLGVVAQAIWDGNTQSSTEVRWIFSGVYIESTGVVWAWANNAKWNTREQYVACVSGRLVIFCFVTSQVGSVDSKPAAEQKRFCSAHRHQHGRAHREDPRYHLLAVQHAVQAQLRCDFDVGWLLKC